MQTLEKEITNSSQVEKIKYLPEEKTLRVTYKNKTGGSTYDYYGVPKEIWDGLIAAESVGKYLNAEVKSKYAHKRLD